MGPEGPSFLGEPKLAAKSGEDESWQQLSPSLNRTCPELVKVETKDKKGEIRNGKEIKAKKDSGAQRLLVSSKSLRAGDVEDNSTVTSLCQTLPGQFFFSMDVLVNAMIPRKGRRIITIVVTAP